MLGEGEGGGHVALLKPSFPATGRKLIGQGNMHVAGFRRHFRFAGISETKGLMVTPWNNGALAKLKRDLVEKRSRRGEGKIDASENV